MLLVAMVAAHNEMRYLPRWIENVSPHVDAIVALDDRSTDGSGDFLEAQELVKKIKRVTPRDRATWDEAANHRELTSMAAEIGAEWVIGVDPDERLERDFRSRADGWISWAEEKGTRALSIKVKELWGSSKTYRVDGYWDQKRKDVLFSMKGEMSFDDRPLHGSWAPYAPPRRWLRRNVWHPLADLIVYHCRMIDAQDRIARWERYRSLDPDARWNPMGYDYLIDETGIRLAPLPEERDYVPLEG